MTKQEEVNKYVAEAMSKLQEAVKVCNRFITVNEMKSIGETNTRNYLDRLNSTKDFIVGTIVILDNYPHFED